MKLRIVQRKFDGDEPYALNIVHRRATPAPSRPRFVGLVEEPDEFARVRRWQCSLDLEEPGVKKMTIVKDGDVVRDYRGVTIKGYLSTFKGTTESDRQGDYVDDGAFRDTLKKFMANPVMLADHRNSVANIAGKFVVVREDRKGLYVEGELSDAPGNIDNRFKVAEGSLRTLSMGGIFHYKEDGRGIFKVDLWEGSLVAIPANPDALFSARTLNAEEREFVKTAHLYTSFHDFLEARGSKTMRE